MPRGGRRNGTPGTAYPNRSDLTTTQPVKTAPGQPYGVAGAQQKAQQAIPLPQQTQPVAPAQPQPSAMDLAAGFQPPPPGLISGPSSRPGEPVTAGLPVGAGPGPEANAVQPGDQILANLNRAYQIAPSEGLRALIQQTMQSRGTVQ